MLPPLLTAAAANERWRALEIALGTLGNLACHAGTKQLLLGQAGLPQLLLDTVLWVDDSASLAELCRCLTSLLADSSRQVRRFCSCRTDTLLAAASLLELCCLQPGWAPELPTSGNRWQSHALSQQLLATARTTCLHTSFRPRSRCCHRRPRHGGPCCCGRRPWAGWCGL